MTIDWPPRILAALLALLATSALTYASSYSPAPPTRMATITSATPAA